MLLWLKMNATYKVQIQDPNCNFLLCIHVKPSVKLCLIRSDQIKELNMLNWVFQDKEKCVINEDKSADENQISWGLKTIIIVLGAQSGTQNDYC